MKFKAVISTFLAATFMFAAVPAFAGEVTPRDAELMAALQSIADHGVVDWTLKQYQAFDSVLDAGWYKTLGLAATAGVAYVKYVPANLIQDHFNDFAFRKSLTAANIEHAKTAIRQHGPTAALVLVGLIAYSTLKEYVYTADDRRDADRMRLIAGHNPQIYRAALAQFLRLNIAEQFLIAKQDDKLASDLIALADHLNAPKPKKAGWFR